VTMHYTEEIGIMYSAYSLQTRKAARNGPIFNQYSPKRLKNSPNLQYGNDMVCSSGDVARAASHHHVRCIKKYCYTYADCALSHTKIVSGPSKLPISR